VALMGYRQGWFPPGLRSPGHFGRVTRRLIAAHDAAVEAIKGGKGDPQAGLCLQLPAFEPARPGDPACEAACRELVRDMEDAYLERLTGDWVGVQYYTRQRVDPAYADGFAPAPDGVPLTLMGWELHPEGLYRAIASAARSGLPVYVTENGIATADDAQRVEFIRAHLEQVARAIRDGIDVRGFHYWSSFDNFEWAEGYRPTFGLIGIDRDDGLRRTVRPSARAYGAVARTGSLKDLTSAP
jgi:beta-glucosidase